MLVREKLGKWVTIRPEPVANGYIGELEPGHEVVVEGNLYNDLNYSDSTHKWHKVVSIGPVELDFDAYVNAVYPPNGARYKEVDESEIDKLLIVEHNANGTVSEAEEWVKL